MKKALIPLLAIFLSGCTKIDVAYYIVSYKIKSYVENSYNVKDNKTEKSLHNSWDQELTQNKQPIFNELSQFIDQTKSALNDQKLEEKELDGLFLDFSLRQKKIIQLFEKSISLTLSSVNAEEMKNHQKYLLKKIADDDDTDDDVLEKYRDRLDNMVDFAFNSVNKTQEGFITAFVQNNQIFLLNQKNIRRQFAEKLTGLYPDRSAMVAYFIGYYSSENSVRSEEYKIQRQEFERNLKHLILDLWSASTDKQRKYFYDLLDSLRKQLTASA